MRLESMTFVLLVIFCPLGVALPQSSDLNFLEGVSTDSLLKMAKSEIYQDPNTSFFLSKHALELARKDNNTVHQAQALVYLGVVSEVKSDYKQGISFLNEARKLAINHGHDDKQALALLNLGNIHYRLDNFDFALQYFIDANRIFEEIGDKRLMASALNNQAMIFQMYGDYEVALNHMDSAIAIYDELGMEIWAKRTKENSARMMTSLGEPQKALSILFELQEYYQKEESDYDLSNIYYNIAEAQLAMGDTTQAKVSLQKALEYYRKLGIKFGIGSSHRELAHIYKSYSEFNQSEKHFVEALSNFQQAGDLARAQETYTELADLYLLKGDSAAALAHLLKSNELIDSLKIKDQNQMKERLAISFESERYRDQLTASVLEVKNNRIWLIITLVLLALVLVFSIRLYSNLNQKKKILRQLRDLNDQIAVQNKELEELNSVKARMFSIIAHDLRSPLALLQGSLQLINTGKMNEEDKEGLLMGLGEAVTHTRFTLDNLFHWSKNEMEGSKLSRILFDLNNVIEDTLPLYRWMMDQKGIVLENACEDTLPVYADRDQMRFVLRNLIHNAFKFTSAGGSIKLNCYRTSRGETALEIHDTGEGLSRDKIEAIERGDELETCLGTNREIGSGLGLTMVKEFIELNEGKLEIESVLRRGSVFRVILPGTARS